MRVRIVLKNGQEVMGTAAFSPDRTKRSVFVVFDEALRIELGDGYFHRSTGAEFSLTAPFSRCVWGQGTDYHDQDMSLHSEDAVVIIAGGGG